MSNLMTLNDCVESGQHGLLISAGVYHDHKLTKWYTVCLSGHPIEGSTSDKDEAQGWLRVAQAATDGEAYLVTTSEPLAS